MRRRRRGAGAPDRRLTDVQADGHPGHQPEANPDGAGYAGNGGPDAHKDADVDGNTFVCADRDTLLLRQLSALSDDSADVFRVHVRTVHSESSELPRRRDTAL